MSWTPSTFTPGKAKSPSSLVELNLSCKKLSDKDVFSKSDPFCVTYIRSHSGVWEEIHRTEVVQNTINPVFVKKPKLPYRFEEEQKLRFEIYDADSKSARLSDHDFLGSAMANLGSIVSSGTAELPVFFKKSRTSAILVILVDEVSSCKEEIELEFMAKRLKKKNIFGRPDPFLQISRASESGIPILVHRTETINRTVQPHWKSFSISLQELCNGDQDVSLQVECYDNEMSGNHKALGTVFNHGKAITGRTRFTFLDFVRGGCELQTTFAIDFTASNGDPSTPDSLHFINPHFPSPYARAIQSVGTIIRDYDSDKKFPVLGFGARIPPNGIVSHEFFVNGSQNDPYCNDVTGILEAYQQCIRSVELYGPTNFSPVIRHVAQFASTYRNGTHYFILVIITDGVITDFEATKKAIVEASNLPMSIIIVGVGGADFETMELLDADGTSLSANGVKAVRDIVQFVPDPLGTQGSTLVLDHAARCRFSREVLAELPGQFLGYMKMRGLQPKPPRADISQLPPDPELAY
ncbi:unnamed protein product [Cyprideis torosa]|uniref:Uncharacterized protein n=1 Tax=Cyprideis torosa TaxID=163714 RepID=A0A7R8WMX2_9CRUS|nr:unnamed protein product [Cyprideis torosa]CAG0898926.1 unnamed protein product [Cyprideis torosa]